MTRSRVEDRAHDIYDYLTRYVDTPFKKCDLLEAIGLTDGRTTRAAIQRARELAHEDGLYLTVPVYDNGFTMGLTADPSAALDPALWLGRVEHGVSIPRKVSDEFMRSRMSKLSASERAYVNLQDQVNQLVESTQKSAQALAKALMDERRASRREQDSDEGSDVA